MYEYKAVVDKVVDGDTLDATVDLGFGTWRKDRYRLLGIDTPEMRGIEKPKGEVAKQALIDMLEGKEIVIHTSKGDSFGRWLAIIYSDGVNVNDCMIEQGYARKW